MECRRRALLLASMALIIRRHQRQQKIRFWIRQIFTEEKKQRGEWENLVHELQDDRKYYYRYLRMDPDRFEHLFSLVELLITKQDTNYRKCIPARKRLVMCATQSTRHWPRHICDLHQQRHSGSRSVESFLSCGTCLTWLEP